MSVCVNSEEDVGRLFWFTKRAGGSILQVDHARCHTLRSLMQLCYLSET